MQRIEEIQKELGLPIDSSTPDFDVWERPELAFHVKGLITEHMTRILFWMIS